MPQTQLGPKSADWFRRDAERNRRARAAMLRRDGRKSVGRNLEEGIALISLGFEALRTFGPRRG